LKYINEVERAFLWASKEATSGAKYKVNWETGCRPKIYGGLGVSHMGKFAMALRLRWPWLEWTESDKIWVGTGNTCTEEDMDIFYAATTITIGNGQKAPFWPAPWIQGRALKDIAPKIFESSSCRKCSVAKALSEDTWVSKIKLDDSFTSEHMVQFLALWTLLNNVHLENDSEDSIVWKLTTNSQYSAASAYNLQFLGL
jgi:hypothetical protein